ncbi:hypothetical protein D3C78_1714210 [compost metagenome]
MRLMAPNNCPISLVLRTSMRPVKSPPAILSKWSPAWCSGRSTVRLMKIQQPSASTSAIASIARVTVREILWSTSA